MKIFSTDDFYVIFKISYIRASLSCTPWLLVGGEFEEKCVRESLRYPYIYSTAHLSIKSSNRLWRHNFSSQYLSAILRIDIESRRCITEISSQYWQVIAILIRYIHRIVAYIVIIVIVLIVLVVVVVSNRSNTNIFYYLYITFVSNIINILSLKVARIRVIVIVPLEVRLALENK